MARTRRQSRPANSASNCAWFTSISPSVTAGHHQPGPVPVEQLQPIRLSGAEDKDGPRERVLAQLVLHHRGQAVMALAEVDGLRRHHDPHPVRRKDHGPAAKARTIAAIRSADAPGSSRTATAPTTISGPVVSSAGGPPSGGATTIAANSTASRGAGNTSLPFRASVRQDDR
jgi:hypothetical protein